MPRKPKSGSAPPAKSAARRPTSAVATEAAVDPQPADSVSATPSQPTAEGNPAGDQPAAVSLQSQATGSVTAPLDDKPRAITRAETMARDRAEGRILLQETADRLLDDLEDEAPDVELSDELQSCDLSEFLCGEKFAGAYDKVVFGDEDQSYRESRAQRIDIEDANHSAIVDWAEGGRKGPMPTPLVPRPPKRKPRSPRFSKNWPPHDWESSSAPESPSPDACVAWLDLKANSLRLQETINRTANPSEELEEGLAAANATIVRDTFRIVEAFRQRGFSDAPIEPEGAFPAHEALLIVRKVMGWLMQIRDQQEAKEDKQRAAQETNSGHPESDKVSSVGITETHGSSPAALSGGGELNPPPGETVGAGQVDNSRALQTTPPPVPSADGTAPGYLGLMVDKDCHRVQRGEHAQVEFGNREKAWNVFLYLYEAKGSHRSLGQILENVWEKSPVTPNTAQVAISTVRGILNPLGIAIGSMSGPRYSLVETKI